MKLTKATAALAFVGALCISVGLGTDRWKTAQRKSKGSGKVDRRGFVGLLQWELCELRKRSDDQSWWQCTIIPRDTEVEQGGRRLEARKKMSQDKEDIKRLEKQQGTNERLKMFGLLTMVIGLLTLPFLLAGALLLLVIGYLPGRLQRTSRSLASWPALVGGALLVVSSLLFLTSFAIHDESRHYQFVISTGYSFYMFVIGVLCSLVSGGLALRYKPSDGPGQENATGA